MIREQQIGILVGIISLANLLPLPLALPSLAEKDAKPVNGAQVFQQHCASCHAGGANRVNSSRPVAGSNQLSSLPTFKSYLSAPPGHMPYYEHVVNDPVTLKALYKYCQTLKKQPVKQALTPQRSLTPSGKLADAR